MLGWSVLQTESRCRRNFTDPEAIAEDIIRDVGTNLVVGLPLGLGKANHIVNALYARAAADRTINLTFFPR